LYRCGLMSGQRCRRSPTFTLTDDILATDPETQPYKFTEVDDQVVIVDPAKKRVIAVIGPKVRDRPSAAQSISIEAVRKS
jgi:hypothetical protein